MNDEKRHQIKLLAGLVVVIVCSGLYAWGGMETKALRRFIAPIICAGFLSIVNRDPLQFIKAPLLMLASSLGYGADETLIKVWKRLYVGFTFCLATTIDKIIQKKWISVIFAGISIIGVFVLYGVFNPVHARNEETLIGAIIYMNAILPAIRKD